MTKQSNPQGNPNNPAQQGQQGQPLAAHHHQTLQAAGINWQGLPWQQIIGIMQALLAVLASQQANQPQATPPGQAPASQP